MRGLHLKLLFSALALSMVLAQSIYNVRTDRSSYSVPGSAVVYWNFSGVDPASHVKLALLDSNGVYFCTIANNIPIRMGPSGYHWNIQPTCTRDNGQVQNITTGNYSIRVRIINTQIMAESPPFTLNVSSPPSGSITNVRTDKNRYTIGDECRVYWNVNNAGSSSRVRIALLDSNRQYFCTLATGVAASEGVQGYAVRLNSPCRRDNGTEMNITPGQYAVRVRLEGTQQKGESALFYIFRPRTVGFPTRVPPRLPRGGKDVRKMMLPLTFSLYATPYLAAAYEERQLDSKTYRYGFTVISFNNDPSITVWAKVKNSYGSEPIVVAPCYELVQSESTIAPDAKIESVPTPPANLSPGGERRVAVVKIRLPASKKSTYCGHTYRFTFRVAFPSAPPCQALDRMSRKSQIKKIIVNIQVPAFLCR